MVVVRVVEPVTRAFAETLREVAARSARAAGHEVVGEGVHRALADPDGRSVGAIAEDATRPLGAALLAPAGTEDPSAWELGLALDPRADTTTGTALLTALADDRATRGGGSVVAWVPGADERSDAMAAAAAFLPQRTLLRMEVALPVAPAPLPDGVRLAPFRPGQDEVAWLTVNNRAFAGHPEQGGWPMETLLGREAEAWFDPADLLMAWDDRGLAGSCWTKVHDAEDPADRRGEIYVIGVDPSRHGTGLGRALTVAGLDHLHRTRHLRTGMLFVDAANPAALALYESIGFRAVRADRAYLREVAPA